MAELTPEDIAYFEIARRRIEDAYQQSLAQNQYETNALRGEQARQEADLIAQLDQLRTGITSEFAGGGLLNSGLYQKALGDFQGARQRQVGMLQGSFADRINALQLARQQIGQTRTGALSDLETERQSRLNALASQISSVAGLGGAGFDSGYAGHAHTSGGKRGGGRTTNSTSGGGSPVSGGAQATRPPVSNIRGTAWTASTRRPARRGSGGQARRI
jgi:hypothetical protein